MSKSSTPLCILYGSATGNAEHIAKDLAEKYEKLLKTSPDKCYFPSAICCEMDEYKRKKCPTYWDAEPEVPGTKHGLIVVTSTTGNGDAPENAGRFVRYLKRKTTAPLQPFKHCAFAVLGLGDTNYDQFCNTGKAVDKKLGELGGTRAKEMGMADEATGLEEVVEPWVDSVLMDITIACSGMNDFGSDKGGIIEEEKSSIDDDKKPAPVTNSKKETIASDGTVSNIKEEEKKIEVEETPQLIQAESASHTSLSGLSALRSLLSCSNGASLPSAPLNCIPSLGPSLSSCALIDQADEDDHRPRGMSLSEADNATITTSSTTAVHYTLNHPYESNILDAKYLTNTNIAGAEEASKCLSDGDYDDDEKMIKAMECYEKNFPLCPPKDGGKSDSDLMIYERNGKRVIEMRLGLPDDFTLEYQPGDSIGLIVPNSPHATKFILSMLHEKHGIAPTQKVLVDEKHAITVSEAVRYRIDLCSPIRNKRILLSLSQFASNPEEESALCLLASKTPQGEELYTKYIDEQRRTVVDILREFPSCQNITLEALMAVLPSIAPRYYSVTSSPLSKGEHALSLTVAFSVVDYLTPSLLPNTTVGQRRIGGLATRYLEAVCSQFLCDSSHSAIPPSVKVFPKPTGEFLMPSDLSKPLVLIGPGTGIAPFMGFISHREALIQSTETTKAASVACEGTWRGGYELEEDELHITKRDARGLKVGADYRDQQNVGSVDVFFGCRYSDHDWLYKEDMMQAKTNRLIENLYTAFSREGNKAQKYVQDIMKNDAACADRLMHLIMDEGAVVYVCGDGNAMGRDVQDTIVDLIATRKFNAIEDGENKARAYLEQMKEEKKFLMDIWS